MKPGDRQIADGRAFKEATGSTPNGVANSFLNSLRGEFVTIRHYNIVIEEGILDSFDSFAVKLSEGVLVFKGPGVSIRKGQK